MTRHELKEQLQHDHFTDAVSGAVLYAREHRDNVTRWAVGIGIALVLGGAAIWYATWRNSVRQQDLENAFAVLEAPVGTPSQLGKTFATQEAKNQAHKFRLGRPTHRRTNRIV